MNSYMPKRRQSLLRCLHRWHPRQRVEQRRRQQAKAAESGGGEAVIDDGTIAGEAPPKVGRAVVAVMQGECSAQERRRGGATAMRKGW